VCTITDEKPVAVRRRQLSEGGACSLYCIVHYDRCVDEEIVCVSSSQFDAITDAVHVRQSQSSECNRLDDICSLVPRLYDPNRHGCHRWCYKNFINISRLRAQVNTAEESHRSDILVSPTASQSLSSRRSANVRSHLQLFPQHECIFCGTERKYLPSTRSSEYLRTCVTKVAEERIKECAVKKNDYNLLGKISGEDLLAREARYHESCRRQYVKASSQETTAASSHTHTALPEVMVAHQAAFEFLVSYIESKIIQDKHVECMTMLKDRYLMFISENYPDSYKQITRRTK